MHLVLVVVGTLVFNDCFQKRSDHTFFLSMDTMTVNSYNVNKNQNRKAVYKMFIKLKTQLFHTVNFFDINE